VGGGLSECRLQSGHNYPKGESPEGGGGCHKLAWIGQELVRCGPKGLAGFFPTTPRCSGSRYEHGSGMNLAHSHCWALVTCQQEQIRKSSKVVHGCNPSTWEVEIRGSRVPGQPGLHSPISL
jgi:hypothetical protein